MAEVLDVQIAPAFEKFDGDQSQTPEARKVLEPDKQWPEYGPDPILRKDSFDGEDQFVPIMVGDLIGQTFDTGTLTPAIHGASAIVPPPAMLGAEGGQHDYDHAWNMAKLRFRRVLHPLGVGAQLAMPANGWKLDRDLLLAIGELGELKTDDELELMAGDLVLVAALKVGVAEGGDLILRRRDDDGALRATPLRLQGLPDATRLYLCLRRLGLGETDEGQPLWEVTFYSDEGTGAWRPLGFGQVRIAPDVPLAFSKPDGVTLEYGTFHASHWTPAYWTQFLGAAKVYDAAGSMDAIEGLTLVVVDAKWLELRDGEDAALRLPPRCSHDNLDWGNTNFTGFYYRVLVTKTVHDASGTPRGEAFVGLYEAEKHASGKLQHIPSEKAPDLSRLQDRLRARIMLWQEVPWAVAPKHNPKEDNPWELIFPKAAEDERAEARARIVQIMAPIEEKQS